MSEQQSSGGLCSFLFLVMLPPFIKPSYRPDGSTRYALWTWVHFTGCICDQWHAFFKINEFDGKYCL